MNTISRQAKKVSNRLVRPVLLFLFVQIIFWALLYLVEANSQPRSFALPATLELFLSDADGEFDPSATPIEVPYGNEPYYFYRDPTRAPRGMYRIRFERPETPPPYGFFVGMDRHIGEILLNGSPIAVNDKATSDTIMAGFSPGVYVLPEERIVDGENILDVVLNWDRTKVISNFAVGPLSELRVARTWGRSVAEALPLASMGALAFMGLLCVVVPWPREEHLRIGVFVMTLAAAGVRNLQFFGIEIVTIYPLVYVTHFLAVYMYLCGFIAMALVWGEVGRHVVKTSAWVFGLAVAAMLAGWPLFMESGAFWVFPSYFFWGYLFESVLTVLCAIVAYAVLLHRSTQAGAVRLIEFGIILFCVTIIFVEHLDHRLQLNVPFAPGLPIKNYITSVVTVILPLGLCATIATQMARANRVVSTANEMLERRLAEKEAEIRQQAHNKALVDERRRLMQDMHDGFGANLYGVMTQARDGSLAQDRIADALQQCLDELRLIVDSLDSAGDDLGMALGTFRGRIEGRLRSAGIALGWRVDREASSLNLGAAEVLQIYRILQEACANAIRHANCSRINISLRQAEDSAFAAILEIADDGRGMATSGATHGKGLLNMTSRAERIGAQLLVESKESGTKVRLFLPDTNESETL